MMFRILLVVGFLISLPNFANAVKVSKLYQDEISVPAQTHDIREKAVQEAFVNVLKKLTGDVDIVKNPVIKESLKKANYYVQEYNYSAPTTSTYNYLLNVSFQKADLDQLIKNANVPFWNENRPLILVWAVVNTDVNSDKDDEIIGSESASTILQSMSSQSDKMGLPLIFPMMDVTDMANVAPADITEMDQEKLLAAGKRYAADGVLIGNIEHTNYNYQSRWLFVFGGEHWGWKLDNKDETELGMAVINHILQTVTKKSRNDNNAMQVTLIINNINQRNDLINLMRHLQQLPLVKHTQLSKVVGDSVELSLLVRGSLDSFQQNATLGKRLIFKSQEEENNKLVYDWVH